MNAGTWNTEIILWAKVIPMPHFDAMLNFREVRPPDNVVRSMASRIENKIMFNITLIGGATLVALTFIAGSSPLRFFDLPAGVLLILAGLAMRRRSRRHRHRSRV